MIHHVLTGTKKELQVGDLDWWRINIIHIPMEHKGHALKVIIDNSSRMNVISINVVERSGLKVEKHPTLY